MKNSEGNGIKPIYENDTSSYPASSYLQINNAIGFSDFEKNIIKLHRFFEDQINQPLRDALYLQFGPEEIDSFIAQELIYIDSNNQLHRSEQFDIVIEKLVDKAYEQFHTISDVFDCDNPQHLDYVCDILMLQLGSQPVFNHVFQGEYQLLPHIREIKFELVRTALDEVVTSTIKNDFGTVIANSFDFVSEIFQNDDVSVDLTFTKATTSNNNLVIYIDYISVENSKMLSDTSNILIHLVDYFRQMAKSIRADKLYLQCDPINERIATFLKKRYLYVGRLPMIPRGNLQYSYAPKNLEIFSEDSQRDIKNLTVEVEIHTAPLENNLFKQLILKNRAKAH